MANPCPKDTWNPDVLHSHPAFWPLIPGASDFVSAFQGWPNLLDYQNFLNMSDSPVLLRSGKTLTVVTQDESPSSFEDAYEPRIYLRGELQTRRESWHDFFQILVWRLFPETKATLNALHYQAIKSRTEDPSFYKQRSVLENTLTQYDECGAVIISPDESLLQLVKDFDWHTLFWKQRKRLKDQFKCIVFGHAVYEKLVNPYIGMTCHAVLLQVPPPIFNAPASALIEHLDPLLAQQFTNQQVKAPQDLSPFPLLGVPGWHSDNAQERFYSNTNYFRPGRKPRN